MRTLIKEMKKQATLAELSEVKAGTYYKVRKVYNLLKQLNEAKSAYNEHKAKSEWYEAGQWADIHSHINKEIYKYSQ